MNSSLLLRNVKCQFFVLIYVITWTKTKKRFWLINNWFWYPIISLLLLLLFSVGAVQFLLAKRVCWTYHHSSSFCEIPGKEIKFVTQKRTENNSIQYHFISTGNNKVIISKRRWRSLDYYQFAILLFFFIIHMAKNRVELARLRSWSNAHAQLVTYTSTNIGDIWMEFIAHFWL